MSRRRRVGFMLGGVLLLAIVVLGIQSWRVVSAIVDAERDAVVPLPTRESDIVFGGVKGTVPTPTTQAPVVLPTATTAPSDQLTPELPGVVEPPAPAPATEEPQPQATSAATVLPTPTPTVSAVASDDDNPSRLDVVRQVVQAGMEDGDPGRSKVWDGRTELYILVLGVDRREDGGDQNADVIIIAHLDLIQKRMAAVSIPRDLLVEIPEVGLDKINGSYNYGVQERPDDPVAGVAKVRDTIEYVFGIPIDDYVLLDFGGFEAVVDAIGGVEIDVPAPIHDDEYPTEDYGTEVVNFDAGPQRMDGDRALKYVRTRHGDSDDGRRDRQRQLLLALFKQGKSFSSVTRADRIILALGDSVQTSFPLEEQLTLARLAYEMEETAIEMTTLGEPLLQAGETPDGRWAYVGDMNAIIAFVQDALVIEPAPTETP